jgi:hypothetical protein
LQELALPDELAGLDHERLDELPFRRRQAHRPAVVVADDMVGASWSAFGSAHPDDSLTGATASIAR